MLEVNLATLGELVRLEAEHLGLVADLLGLLPPGGVSEDGCHDQEDGKRTRFAVVAKTMLPVVKAFMAA